MSRRSITSSFEETSYLTQQTTVIVIPITANTQNPISTPEMSKVFLFDLGNATNNFTVDTSDLINMKFKIPKIEINSKIDCYRKMNFFNVYEL